MNEERKQQLQKNAEQYVMDCFKITGQKASRKLIRDTAAKVVAAMPKFVYQ